MPEVKPELPPPRAAAPICACGWVRAPSDPFFLTPNPMLPSRAGAYLLKAEPRQAQERVATNKNATPCNVRACRSCGALYACPVET